MADIRDTGYLNYRQLQKENQKPFEPSTATNEDWYRHLTQRRVNDYNNQPTEYVGLQAAEAGYGESQYDEGLTSASQLQDLGDIRYENQPWYDTLANGIGKMLGTAGTTFVSSLVGLPYGLFQAANQGRWSALWDNSVTQGLAEADKWLEENMTNYRSQVQQNSPWYDPENMFSMNFIADDVIKNMGFTLGAAASMAVGSGSLGLMSRALGFVNDVSKTTKGGAALLSSLFSATGEGMIEARQGVEERNKLEMQKLNDALIPEYNALGMEKQEIDRQYALTGDYDTYKLQMNDYLYKKQELDNRKAAGEQQIIESGQEMGNTILLANQGLLTLGNLIQFGKGMVKSFDSARHAAEVSKKAVKPFGVGATLRRTAEHSGYEIEGKGLGRAIAATKGILTEGSEEMNQQWIQSSAGASVNEADINDYWKAKLDPEAYRDTTQALYTVGSILDRGFQESWGDTNQWEQFVIGGLTGMMGSYSPTKLFNQDKTKAAWDPRRYGSWEGGAYNALRDFNREYNQYQENIDDLNKILASEDFPARVMSAVGHTYTQGEKDAAAEGDDKKAWKDADDKQMVHDIQAFLRAGKLDDLRAIYNDLGSQLSDADVENIIKSTTKEISAEEDKQNFDRQADEQIAAHQRRITEIDSKIEKLIDDRELLKGSDEIATYTTAIQPEIERLLAEKDKENDDIYNLEQQKQSYVGKKYYEGAYVDREGNVTASDDDIREIVKHNSEELNRKLNSYLDSIDYVNRRTGGTLTKDQEDNLAYLHNLGKESDFRMRKIMAGVRKNLPNKFLLKTPKTPEQLAKENTSSDLVFTKDENTKEGYVEVDTSMMNDSAFADFFQEEVLRGGNIRPEFAETADERAAREEEEKGLPIAEKKKKARERVSKKWKDALQKAQDDAKEQWDTNWRNMIDNFFDNYQRSNNSTVDETAEAFMKVSQDLQDASKLYDQAGEFYRTLHDYMAHPGKIEEDKAKAESEAQKAAEEQQATNKFEGKDAKQMKQELATGLVDEDEFFNFANMDLSGDAPAPLAEAQQEAKKAQEGNQKASALKQHIQELDVDEDIKSIAMQMVDDANLATDNPEDLSIDIPELSQVPLDQIDPNASIDDVDRLNYDVQQVLADAFNAFEEDKNARDDIPDTAPTGALDGVETPETGHDATTKTKTEVVAPEGESSGTGTGGPVDITRASSTSKATAVVPKAPLTENSIDTIIGETSKSMATLSTNGTWRSTTTRHPYGKSTGTYHETLIDKNSVQYKRSKAIWEYLNDTGAFYRQENASDDRIKPNDVIHFMVKNFAREMYGKDFGECNDEEKLYSLAIIMLDDNGEIIGDLPLAQLEPSFRGNNPTQQVKDLMSLQEKVFDAFTKHYAQHGRNEAIVDGVLQIEGRDNLNLTFDNSKKPLVSKVKQVMGGVVPYRKAEKNTLNDVANGASFELGVAVTGDTIAKKRGDKTQHAEIVMPHVGTVGQPYLLLPTPSGKQVAVPFYMNAFNASQHKNTEFYKLLNNALHDLLSNNSYTTAGQKEAFNKALDVIEGLLQIKAQDGVRTVVVSSDTITFNFQSLTDPNQKISFSVPSGTDTVAIIRAIADQMSGIPINVSLQFLNDSIEAGGRKADYNKVIGEIADVNLPKATNHTVNGWFTVELAPSAGLKNTGKRGEVKPRTTGRITENINGRYVDIDVDLLVAFDAVTGDNVSDDEQVALRLAQIKAAKPQYQDKDRIQVSINGELRTYDVKENKFVKNAPIKKGDKVVVPQQQTEQEEKPDVEGVSATASEATSFAEHQTSTQPNTQSKTLEQIEGEMKQRKIVGRQTKDAWAAIPDDLKMKLVNEGQPLQLAFNKKTMVVSLSDREGLIQGLIQANMAAKAGNLTVSEAPKYRRANSKEQKRANIQKERRWLQQNLPMFNTEDRLKLIQGLIEVPDAEGWAWGRFQSGIITLSDMAAAGTTYHEAFHAVTQTLLDDAELDTLYEAASERYKENDAALVEELLAEDFRKYVQREETPIIGYIRKVFRRILHAMRNLNNYRDPVNLLFYKINNGEFKDTLPRVSRGNNAFYNKVRTDRLLDKDHPMHKAIEKAFKQKDWTGNFPTINQKWRKFKDTWQAEGYTPVMQNVYSESGNGRVIFLGVRTNADEALSLKESRQPKVREQYAAQQARSGRLEAFAWNKLDPEIQVSLQNDINREQYESMSLEEKEQWVKCRA